MLIFRKLKWKNFLSTGDVYNEIDFQASEHALIVGTNGSGKSTILDALTFVLFGKSFRGVNKPNLINSINEKNCRVEIDFISSGKEYKIVRGIKPAVFEIYVNDILINQDSDSRDYQDYLERQILKMNYKSFTQIVILGSASFTPFMQLSAAERRSIIEDLLDIQIFSVMNTITKQRLQENKEHLFENTSRDREYLSKHELLRKQISSLELGTEKKNEKIKQEISQLEDIKNKYQIRIANVEIQLDEISYAEKIDISGRSNTHSQMIGIRAQLESKIADQKESMAFYRDNTNCPTCHQEISEDFRQDKMTKTASDLQKFTDGYKELKEKLETVKKEIDEYTAIRDQIKNYRYQLSSLKGELENVENNIARLQKEETVDDNNKELLQQNKKELEEVGNLILENNLQRKELLVDREYLEMALTLLKDGGIKSKIIKQYLPIINKQVNKYLSAMDFSVNFHLDENFSETIKSRYRDVFTYENFSEGEKMRIDLALLFTWRYVAKLRNSVSTNILILDEVFDSSLDSNGTDEFLKIMYALSTDTHVIVISHKTDQLADKFKKIIRFDKVKGFSRIV
jgi:DNA repair exonuclease SbcCD ATPase subunit